MTEAEIEATIERISKDFVNAVETSGERWTVRGEILRAFSEWIRGMVQLQTGNAALRAKIVALGGDPELP
jgi:hypothetical protein